jgi:hypothetical protein
MSNQAPPKDKLLGMMQQDEVPPDSVPLTVLGRDMATVLQNGTPICNKADPAYQEGAKAGLIWLRNTEPPFYENVKALLCASVKSVMEWAPLRQGLIDRHECLPADFEIRYQKQEGGRERKVVVRKGTGNILQPTHELFILCNGRPYLLACSGTKLTFARNWVRHASTQLKHPRTGGLLPTFCHVYELSTIPDSNSLGRWWALQFRDCGLVEDETTYLAAKALNKFIAEGGARLDMSLLKSLSQQQIEAPSAA